MYIIDPLFTVPLLIGTIGAYLVKHQKSALWLNQMGLVLTSLYVVWSFSAQSIADQKFRLALAEQNIKVSRQKITSAGAFNKLLWRHIAETPDGFLLAYWSWLDDANQEVRFQFIPKNAAIVEQIKSTRTFEAVNWFSKGQTPGALHYCGHLNLFDVDQSGFTLIYERLFPLARDRC